MVLPAETPPVVAATPGRRWRKLFWCVVGIPLFLEVLGFWAVNRPVFRKHADYYWVTATDGLFEAAHKPCDILIYGDSTAMADLDPSIVQDATGLSACNVAVSMPTLDIVGMDPLNRYLERNPRPKYLLLQFSPKNFRPLPYDMGHAEAVDGFIVVMRHYGWGRVLPQIMRHPDYLLMVPQYVYVDGLKQAIKSLHHRQIASSTKGSYIVLTAKGGSACPDVPELREPDVAWVHYLRQFYLSRTDHLLITAAPISNCSPQYLKLKSSFQRVTDGGLNGYLDSSFADDGMHMSRAGAVRYSEDIAKLIKAKNETPEVADTHPHDLR